MKNVLLIEDRCCGSDFLNTYQYLRNRYDSDSEQIRLVNLQQNIPGANLPESVRALITQLDPNILPAIYVDNVLVSSGYVPNLMDVVTLIDSGKPTNNSLKANVDSGNCC